MPKRTDENQREIVDTFRKCGGVVFCTHDVGKGFPDLVLSFKGRLWLIEVKNGSKPPSAQKLTVSEKKFFDQFGEHVKIINSVSAALDFMKKELLRNVSQ